MALEEFAARVRPVVMDHAAQVFGQIPGHLAGLHAALIAGGLASFAGALTGALIVSGHRRVWRIADGGDAAEELRFSVGAFLLGAHAVSAAALWQIPTIGACIAAGLGFGWVGAAVGVLIGLMRRPSQPGPQARAARAAFQAAIGFALLAPLWAYVEIMRLHAIGATGA